jgi:site-specific recombinase XerD
MSTHNSKNSSLADQKDSKNTVLKDSADNVKEVLKDSIENTAFITVESNKKHVLEENESDLESDKCLKKKAYNKEENSYQNFQDRIHAAETLEMYDRNLDRFLVKCNIKSYDALTEMSKKEIQLKLQDHVRWLKKVLHPNSIAGTMAGIFKFLDCNEVEFNDKNIRSMYPAKKKPSNAEAYSLEQLQMLVKRASWQCSKRNQAMVLVFVSSGVRKGSVVRLKMSDLIPIEDTYMIVVYRGEKEEYVTFMTPEAADVLKVYFDQRRELGEELTDDSYVFTNKKGMGKPISVEAVGSIIEYLLQNTKVSFKKDEERGRFNVAKLHGMRKFCDTQMEESGISHSKLQKIMGHMNGLAGLYYDAKSDKLFEEYKKAIPLLTIQPHIREQNKVAELQSQITATDFIKDEEIKTQEEHLRMERETRISDIAAMQEKIAGLEILLRERK